MLIQKQKDFDTLFYDLKEQDLLAIDLEFIRRRTFFPKPALLQIAYGKEKVAVIDLLEVDISSFKKIWQDKKINKILHGAEQDVEILFNLLNCYPNSLFDSQIALQFLTFDESISYQSLIFLLFGENLDKSMQKSNWLKRPLEHKAIEYAQNDVLWLYSCFDKLNRGLIKYQRANWFFEEMEETLNNWKIRFDAKNFYKSINQYSRLNKEHQKLLKKLSIEREKLVRQIDLPRSWVCNDSLLLRIIRFAPKTESHLNDILRNDNCHRDFKKLVIDFFSKSRHQTQAPFKIKKNHITPREKEQMALLKQKVMKKLDEERIHSNLMIRVNDLYDLTKGNKDNIYHNTWRKQWLLKNLNLDFFN